MLKLLGIDVNKWVIYAVTLIFLVAGSLIGYGWWKHDIVSQAEITFNNDQLKKALQETQNDLAENEALNDELDEQVATLQRNNAALTTQLKGVKDFLASPQAASSDRASSDVLKTTVQKLIDSRKALPQ